MADGHDEDDTDDEDDADDDGDAITIPAIDASKDALDNFCASFGSPVKIAAAAIRRQYKFQSLLHSQQ